MYEFWYDYIKPKYQNNAKQCSFFIHTKTENFYKNIEDDVKKYDTSNYEADRPLPKNKNE